MNPPKQLHIPKANLESIKVNLLDTLPKCKETRHSEEVFSALWTNSYDFRVLSYFLALAAGFTGWLAC